MEQTPEIVQTPVTPEPVATPVTTPEFPTDGEVVTSPAGETTKIVIDRDENGNEVGWHKEIVNG
jgi:hypothetical protein